MKSNIIKLSLVMLIGSSTSAFSATNGVITFNGEVTAASCEVKVDNVAADKTISLPTVTSAELGTTDGTILANIQQGFTITVDASCPSTSKPYFINDPAKVNNNGSIKTSVQGGATDKLAIRLFANSNASTVINLTDGQTTQAKPTPASNVYSYVAKYVKLGTEAVPVGAVTGSVTYALIYP